MALKRLVPLQDTFIVSSSTELNFGADEILELGQTPYGNRPSRILMQFSSKDIKEIVESLTEEQLQTLTGSLHLYLSEAKNLPETYSIIAHTVLESWQEGIGREGDDSSKLTGASWTYRNSDLQPWETPGGDDYNAYDGEYAVQGDIVYVLNGEDATVVATYELVADGGGAYALVSGESTIDKIFVRTIFTRDLTTDITIDISDMVREWVEKGNEGLLIRYDTEKPVVTDGSLVSFYSKETHTIYRPYLELKWNDTVRILEPDQKECLNPYGVHINNLRKEYRLGDIARINLDIKDRYPNRVFSTGSLFRTNQVLPETSYWGIKDEYTNEMIIGFDEIATKISADLSGSFFILDTENLEPERYYRLLVQVKTEEQNVVVDNRNIFRVGRNGRN